MNENVCERICINCPAGCHLVITRLENGSFEVTGNTCPRGRTYGIAEMTDPRRTVTASVPVRSEKTPCLPVKTDAALPVALIPALLKQLYAMELELPIAAGTVIIRNFENSSVNVVLTRGAEK
ncbi:MAG: DUF1667 domain-containing protein [Lentisphaeria bacterium]|nr:DUF1667 domain-containing protein [Lentisphaeria bacterium]